MVDDEGRPVDDEELLVRATSPGVYDPVGGWYYCGLTPLPSRMWFTEPSQSYRCDPMPDGPTLLRLARSWEDSLRGEPDFEAMPTGSLLESYLAFVEDVPGDRREGRVVPQDEMLAELRTNPYLVTLNPEYLGEAALMASLALMTGDRLPPVPVP